MPRACDNRKAGEPPRSSARTKSADNLYGRLNTAPSERETPRLLNEPTTADLDCTSYIAQAKETRYVSPEFERAEANPDKNHNGGDRGHHRLEVVNEDEGDAATPPAELVGSKANENPTRSPIDEQNPEAMHIADGQAELLPKAFSNGAMTAPSLEWSNTAKCMRLNTPAKSLVSAA